MYIWADPRLATISPDIAESVVKEFERDWDSDRAQLDRSPIKKEIKFCITTTTKHRPPPVSPRRTPGPVVANNKTAYLAWKTNHNPLIPGELPGWLWRTADHSCWCGQHLWCSPPASQQLIYYENQTTTCKSRENSRGRWWRTAKPLVLVRSASLMQPTASQRLSITKTKPPPVSPGRTPVAGGGDL